MGKQEEIKRLEEELRTTKYNKATQHHIGRVKARIAQLRSEASKSGGGSSEGYAVRKTGDATVALVGFPSVGKSTLLNKLTNAKSKVGAYDFTTLDVIPGLLEYNDSDIQILDIPGIIKGAAEGRGGGKEILSVLRAADLIIILLDANETEKLDVIMEELYDIGIRLNKQKPRVKITKKSRGGLDISTTTDIPIGNDTIKAILKEYKIINANILIHDPIDEDQLIDVLEANRMYTPGIIVVNKVDTVAEEKISKIDKKIDPDLFISADKEKNLDSLKQMIFDKLKLIRVFCKQPGKDADMDEALILRKGNSLKNVCEKLHNSFVERFRYARVWGSAKYPGLKIRSLDHQVEDKDIIELHLD